MPKNSIFSPSAKIKICTLSKVPPPVASFPRPCTALAVPLSIKQMAKAEQGPGNKAEQDSLTLERMDGWEEDG